MEPSIVSRDLVARHLSISTKTLLRYESRGLVQARREGEFEGYGPSEIRRVWTIVSFQRDLGINLAGVEVILKLRDEMSFARDQLDRLAQSLRDSMEEEGARDGRS